MVMDLLNVINVNKSLKKLMVFSIATIVILIIVPTVVNLKKNRNLKKIIILAK